MLIMILLITLFVISALLVRYFHKHKYYEMIQFVNFLFSCAIMIMIISASTKIYRENVLIELSLSEKVYEKHMICVENNSFPELAQYKKEKFNTELEVYKRMAESPWTNWFCNKYVAAMDYIE